MKKNPRTILKWILVLVLVVGIVGAVASEIMSRTGTQDYSEAEALATSVTLESEPPETEPETETETETETEPETEPETETETETEAPETEPETETETEKPLPPDPDADELAELNLDALRLFNEDVIGWIRIPGTELNYPLLQGDDNEYYLRRTWKKTYSVMGCIFMDYRNDTDLSDFNTIIYGHRMRDNTMFGELKHYKQQAYRDDAPYVYLLDDEGTHKYEIFAAYEAAVESKLYKPGLPKEEDRQEVLDTAATMSRWDAGIEPTTDDKILTLVTCTGLGYQSRWIVQAVLVEERPYE